MTVILSIGLGSLTFCVWLLSRWHFELVSKVDVLDRERREELKRFESDVKAALNKPFPRL